MRLFPILLLALGCNYTFKDTIDVDGDGYYETEDCDDADATVYPEAPERCDGVDQDCDGQVDEDVQDTFYADADGDGFGDPDMPIVACELPPHAARNAEDCDDSDGSVHPYTAETCQGIDDDCDGLVDEGVTLTWYTDADGDGYGDAETVETGCTIPSGAVDVGFDCDDESDATNPAAQEVWWDGVDSDCDGDPDPDICLDPPEAGEATADAACTASLSEPSLWLWDVEWSSNGLTYSTAANSVNIMATPAVGPLVDDNGDGHIDHLDSPYVVYQTFEGSEYQHEGVLRVLTLDSLGVPLEVLSLESVTDGSDIYNLTGAGGVAVGDVNADGSPDILSTTDEGRLVALTPAGGLLWVSEDAASLNSNQPAIADADGDGFPEVLFGSLLLDGTTGETDWEFDGASRRTSFMADLDGDDVMEVIVGGNAYDLQGNLLWRVEADIDGRAAVVDLTRDGLPELVMSYVGELYAFNSSGETLWQVSFDDTGDGSPCVADADGDGSPEIGVVGANVFALVDHLGSVEWTFPIDESDGNLGCSAFDLDGDGSYEFLVADVHTLYVLDGGGSAVLQEPRHESGTRNEYPIVADVDSDGNAEIVLATNSRSSEYDGGWVGLYVLGEVNDQWATAQTTWNQHAYCTSGIGENLGLPDVDDDCWGTPNTFRAQGTGGLVSTAAPDLTVALVDVCVDCDAEMLEVSVVVENLGGVRVGPTVDVALYAAEGSDRTLLDVLPLGTRLDTGVRLAPLIFTVPLSELTDGGLVAVVDDDGTGVGTQAECNEDNNELTWNEEVCP
ncbi:MAG: hypothetical protein H6739_23250 [Alphaproteobacteria bacterium]|nr:hypothetical protein [Alphaproteobacteria bacterium]